MKSIFLIIPWILFLGVAGQSTSLYILTAYILIFHHKKQSKAWLQLGLSCCVMWALFPLLSSFNQVMTPTDGITFKDLLKSHFPSSLFGFGCLCIAVPLLSKQITPRQHYFSKNTLLINSLCTLAFIFTTGLFQHLTGWDYRLPDGLGQHSLMADSRYRIRLFHGHPLSFAAVCLAWLTCLCFVPIKDSKQKIYQLCSLLLLIGLLFFTGARSAIAIAFFIIFIAFNTKNLKWSLLSLPFLVALAYSSGSLNRFLQFSWLSPRFKLWSIHWKMFLDRPWSGFGYHAMAQSRPIYYGRLFQEPSPYLNYNAHQLYLEILSEVGFLGISVLFACCWFAMQSLKELVPKPENQKIIWWVVTANLLHGMTQNTYFDATVMAATLICILLPIQGFDPQTDQS